METNEDNNEALSQIETMLNGNKKKPRKHGFFSRKPAKVKEETKVRVKTIVDIPPLVNARRNVGNNDLLKAAIQGKNEAQKDIERYFDINLDENIPAMASIAKLMRSNNFELSFEAMVDRNTFEAETSRISGAEEKDMKLMTLKKFSMYIFDIYLPAMYSQSEDIDGTSVISLLTDIYNYMDLKKLYYVDR